MGRMTLDTATLRAQWEAIREQQGPAAFAIVAHVGDGIALLDALEAERERVRQLFQFLIEWDGQGSVREPDYRDQLQERYCAWIATAEAALATAGGEGVTT